MKKIAVLGSTGSIGRSALAVISKFPDKLKVIALSANNNIDVLCEQIKIFKPRFVCIHDGCFITDLQSRFAHLKIRFFSGNQGLCQMVSDMSIDQVMMSVSGSAALPPLLQAIDSGKDIALANKEALVMAGDLIMRKAHKKGVRIIPVDSEQSAIWQCLEGQDRTKLKRIFLTASGGPFLSLGKEAFSKITVDDALRHPRWKMGRKITIDSATLMNKGLELIEALHLFSVSHKDIEVLVHPEAIIHSMVEFIDGVILAQMSVADMRIPIQYSLTYPKRLSNGYDQVDFLKLKSLNFRKPDFSRFPCLGLAYEAASRGGTMPCVLNAANEVSVDAFLGGEVCFTDIPKVIEKVMRRHKVSPRSSLSDVLGADSWARREAVNIIGRLKFR